MTLHGVFRLVPHLRPHYPFHRVVLYVGWSDSEGAGDGEVAPFGLELDAGTEETGTGEDKGALEAFPSSLEGTLASEIRSCSLIRKSKGRSPSTSGEGGTG